MTNAEETGNVEYDDSDLKNKSVSKKPRISGDEYQSNSVIQIENVLLKEGNSMPKLLWDPKTSNINQDTKLKKFKALIESKHNLSFSKYCIFSCF
jgi:hypothetical protein